MSKTWTIAWKDYKTYFTSPIAYILIAAFMFIMGYMFYFILNSFAEESMRYQQFQGKSMSLTEGVIRPLYGNMSVILLFIAPFITMRLFAEERKNATITLLMTAPVPLIHIVLGKFLSALLLVLTMLALTLTYPLVIYFTGNPDIGPLFTAFLGTLLMAGCYVSIGLLFSSTTENQIVAGALSFCALMFFWLISWAANSVGSFWGELLKYLSLIDHFNKLSRGVLSTADVIFYLSFIGLGIYFTYRVLDSYRWRT